mmetsp:Transcript_22965/g.57496  ORF Transcript_22965/g.57496 Transcript_22965/m.57496 type:complete len:94 (-) Transcript_22965:432-713(-)
MLPTCCLLNDSSTVAPLALPISSALYLCPVVAPTSLSVVLGVLSSALTLSEDAALLTLRTGGRRERARLLDLDDDMKMTCTLAVLVLLTSLAV